MHMSTHRKQRGQHKERDLGRWMGSAAANHNPRAAAAVLHVYTQPTPPLTMRVCVV